MRGSKGSGMVKNNLYLQKKFYIMSPVSLKVDIDVDSVEPLKRLMEKKYYEQKTKYCSCSFRSGV